MSDVIHQGQAALGTLSRWLETISGNLAGAQIYGYKGTRLSFRDALVDTLRDGSGTTTLGGLNPVQVPAGGIAIGATSTDFRQGAIVSTGNNGDLAISGGGWFATTAPGGTLTFTRSGEFVGGEPKHTGFDD